MTTPNDTDNVVWLAHLISVTVLLNIRDDRGNLVRTNKCRRFVDNPTQLRAHVLELVRKHWPDATQEDIEWHDDPDHWDGSGEVWWTTAAEVDGVIRVVNCKQLN